MFPKRLSVTCPRCAGPLDVKLRRRDGFPFVACHNYPHCDWACRLADLAVEMSRMLARAGTTAIPLDVSPAIPTSEPSVKESPTERSRATRSRRDA